MWCNTEAEETKLVKEFSCGTIPERTRRILVVISFKDSSIWDELNFENSKYTTVSLSHLGWITGKFTKNTMCKGKRILNKNRRIIDTDNGRCRRRSSCT